MGRELHENNKIDDDFVGKTKLTVLVGSNCRKDHGGVRADGEI